MARPSLAVAIFAAFGCALVSNAAAQVPTPAVSGAPAALTGEMHAYAWFPGRWACRTVTVGAPAGTEPVPAKLWVVVDGAHNALQQYFKMTMADGKTYRSDDTLRYDAAHHVYTRKTVDADGAQILLVAKGPYKPTMEYLGYVGLQNGKLYHMRATVTIDASQTQMSTATAFWHADTKSWVVQTTGACSKITTSP